MFILVVMLTLNIFFGIFSDGVVSLNEYMAFMISRETENVRSANEVEEAFRAITEGGKMPYVTEEELYQVCPSKLLVKLFVDESLYVVW